MSNSSTENPAGAGAKSRLFCHENESIFRHYADDEFTEGAFDPVLDKKEDGERDEILIASFSSTRDYMLQSADTKNSFDESFRIYPGLINSIHPNAFAARRNNIHLAGLHSGLYGVVFELCLFIMAQGDMFLNIGDPAREVSPKMPKGSVAAFWMMDEIHRTGRVSDEKFASNLVPQCPHRYEFAVYLTVLMLRFVWFHELSHCLNGHVGSLAKSVPNIRLNEFPDGRSLGLIKTRRINLPLPLERFLHAIEFDADRAALWSCFQTQLHDKENIKGMTAWPREARIRLSLFTAFLMSFIFDEMGRRNAEAAGSHPDAYTRLHNMVLTTATHLYDAEKQSYDSFVWVMGALRTLRRSIPGLVNVDQLLDDCGDPAFQERIERINADLERARPYFSSHGYA